MARNEISKLDSELCAIEAELNQIILSSISNQKNRLNAFDSLSFINLKKYRDFLSPRPLPSEGALGI